MNTLDTARKWLEFLASRPEFPAPDALLQAWELGSVTRLCDCPAQCQSFDFSVPESAHCDPVWEQSASGGAVFMMDFRITALQDEPAGRTLELVLYTDHRGHFSGLDVMCTGNSLAVPEHMLIHEPPVRVSGALSEA